MNVGKSRRRTGILEVSLACCKANKKSNSNSKRLAVALPPFGMPSFCKYAQIGDDPRLMAPDKRHLLFGKVSRFRRGLSRYP